VSVPAAALAEQFHLQERMVGGITATYHAVNYVEQLRAALASRASEAAGKPVAAQISNAAKALDAALAPLGGSASVLGIAHRDFGRRLNDLLIGDAQPTASVIAGVDAPCASVDKALDGLRQLQATSIAEMSTTLSRAGLAPLPAWTPPAAPACGPR